MIGLQEVYDPRDGSLDFGIATDREKVGNGVQDDGFRAQLEGEDVRRVRRAVAADVLARDEGAPDGDHQA